MDADARLSGLKIVATLVLSAINHIERGDDEWAEVVRCGSEGKAIWMSQVLKDIIAPNMPCPVEVGAFRGALGWEISLRPGVVVAEEVEDSCASEESDASVDESS